MKRNWIKTGVMVLAAVMGLVSCETAQEKEEKQKEAFVGAYTYETTGEVDLYALGQKFYTLPLNTTGSFDIVACEESNRVAIVKGNDSIYAVVSGNNLLLEVPSLNYTYNDFEVKLVFSGNKATRNADNTLHWQSDVIATATYSSYQLSGNGNIDLVATKQ